MAGNSSSAATCEARPARRPSRDAPVPATRASSSRARFRADGSGYLDGGPPQPPLLRDAARRARQAGHVRPIGQGRLSDQDAGVVGRWHPRVLHRRDGGRARLRAAPGRADGGGRPREARSRKWRQWTAPSRSPSPSPDGTRVAFIASLNGRPVRSYSQPDLFVVDRATGAVTNLTERYDYDIGGGLAGDQRAPRGSSSTRPVWTPTARPSSRWRPPKAGRTCCASMRPAARYARSPTATTKSRGSRRPGTGRRRCCRRRRRAWARSSWDASIGRVRSGTRGTQRWSDVGTLDLPEPEMFWTPLV